MRRLSWKTAVVYGRLGGRVESKVRRRLFGRGGGEVSSARRVWSMGAWWFRRWKVQVRDCAVVSLPVVVI